MIDGLKRYIVLLSSGYSFFWNCPGECLHGEWFFLKKMQQKTPQGGAGL